MAEWSIAAVLKTVELRGSGGSNPSLSAENERVQITSDLHPLLFTRGKKKGKPIIINAKRPAFAGLRNWWQAKDYHYVMRMLHLEHNGLYLP